MMLHVSDESEPSCKWQYAEQKSWDAKWELPKKSEISASKFGMGNVLLAAAMFTGVKSTVNIHLLSPYELSMGLLAR